MIDLLALDQVEDEIGDDVTDDGRTRAARHRDKRNVDACDMEERHGCQHRIADVVLQPSEGARKLENGHVVAVGQSDSFGRPVVPDV